MDNKPGWNENRPSAGRRAIEWRERRRWELVAIVLPRLADPAVVLVLIAVLLVVAGHLPGAQVVLLPLVALWIGVLALAVAVGLAMAAVRVQARPDRLLAAHCQWTVTGRDAA